MAARRIEDSIYEGDSIYENPDRGNVADESNYYGTGNRNTGQAIPRAAQSLNEYDKPDPPDADGNQIELAPLNSGSDNRIVCTASTLSADPAQSSDVIEKKKIDDLTQNVERTTKYLKCLGAGLLMLWLVCLSMVAVFTLNQIGIMKQPGTSGTKPQTLLSLLQI